jgi:hypothetical protein
MKLFNYTKWEVLETYKTSGSDFCVQVRMNIRTVLKQFKVTRITSRFGWCDVSFKVEKINELTKGV